MRKHALLVYPRFVADHILNYEYLTPFFPGKLAVMPPLGLLAFAGLLRDRGGFELRLIDENVTALSPADLSWADIVCVSGMHLERKRICEILDAANAAGKVTVLGGPSVSSRPEDYPQADLLHVGEIGDASESLIAMLRAGGKPAMQHVFRTELELPLEDQPLPALELVDIHRYLAMPLQWSVCNRVPWVKSGARVAKELDRIRAAGFAGTILFVDENLLADAGDLRAVLPEIIAWQRHNNYPFAFTGEASLDLALEVDLLGDLCDAHFTHLFFRVDLEKERAARMPLLDAIERIEKGGIEAIFGIHFGFDADALNTGRRLVEFVHAANAPMIQFNLPTEQPRTPLWNRMLAAATSEPDEKIEDVFRETIRDVYAPEAVFRRMTWNAENVYGEQVAGAPGSPTFAAVLRGLRFKLGTLARVLWVSGIKSGYRRHFWNFVGAVTILRADGRLTSAIEVLLRVAPNAHHLITWAEKLLAKPSAPTMGAPTTLAPRVILNPPPFIPTPAPSTPQPRA
jgi:hypothetical protein